MAYASPFMKGKNGRSALDQFAKQLREDRIHGRSNLNKRKENEIMGLARKEFEVEGKVSPWKIRESDFEKRVLNRLKIDKNDLVERDDVDRLQKRYGIEHRTDRVAPDED